MEDKCKTGNKNQAAIEQSGSQRDAGCGSRFQTDALPL